jgi:hypothetical protein
MNSNANLDIKDYTISELKDLFSLDMNDTKFDIRDKLKFLEERVKKNKPLVKFLEEALKKLEEYYDSKNDDNNNNNPRGINWDAPIFPLKKNRGRGPRHLSAIDFKEDQYHYVMEKKRLGIQNTTEIETTQGLLNPNLKNTNTLIVCIDSQYRQNILPFAGDNISLPSFNTDYTLDLSDPIKNVLSITLTSVEIPTTWYTFSKALGNTCFNISLDFTDILNNDQYCICIDDGNYTYLELLEELEKKIYQKICEIYSLLDCSGITLTSVEITFNHHTKILSIKNIGVIGITLTFYTPRGFICNKECGAHTYINNSLGWYLGFRGEPDENGDVSITIPPFEENSTPNSPNPTIIKGDVPINIYGSRYFILSVDDYNQNHLNKGLVSIIETSKKLDLPSYYSIDDLSPNPNINDDIPQNVPKCFAVKTAPRKLTQAQLYSINEILINRNTPKIRYPGPTTSDVLGIIPLKNIQRLGGRGEPYIEFGGSLQTNKRIYFGPVNIERLRVRLVDDKGNLVNLHDNDWSFTLQVEQLYQY